MIRLTTEQAQQIEEALEDIVRVFKFETGTPVETLATIRAARANFQNETSIENNPADSFKAQEPVAIGSEWKPCMKLPVVVHVREQREGESHVSTREGITPVRPDDLIMRGVAGEEYPIGRELFNKTYTFDTAAPVQQAEQEPVAYCCGFENTHPDGWIDCKIFRDGEFTTPLYAAPQPVQQVDLTDDEVEALFWKWKSATEYPVPLFEFRDIARAVIAADREKNK